MIDELPEVQSQTSKLLESIREIYLGIQDLQ